MKLQKNHQHSIIQKYLAMIIHADLQDEDYGIVSITYIEISPDASRAWITVDTTASTEEKLELVELLNENSGIIRQELAEVLQIRHTPALTFKADLARESEEAVEKLLAEATPLSDEGAAKIINKEKSKFTIPVRAASKETSMKETNQKVPPKVNLPRMNVSSSKSSSNKLPR